jgi:PhzF family phenazine biosynthesis protein
MPIPIYQVDAFTDKPFAGNPAGVCILAEPTGEKWMQSVAQEMNLSETAFVYREKDGFRLRWFTPAVEVDLCGHATLATAHILWETGRLQPGEEARFYTKSGLLKATPSGSSIELDFPSKPEESADPLPGMAEALGTSFRYVCKNKFDYLVEVESEEIVRNLKPDFSKLLQIQARGVIVTSKAAKEPFDFVSRFFAPRVGVNEDPVTGSAHCFLGPYWGKRLGKNSFLAFQASERGGEIRIRLDGDRVFLGGVAVTIFRGELSEPAS